MKKIKLVALFMVLVVSMVILCGCTTEDEKESQRTLDVGREMIANQKTPTDITYSLQRYNLIRRAYWINGMRDKARTLPAEVEKPLGYVYLLVESGAIIARLTVDGQVTSTRSYLSADTTRPNYPGATWLPDVDGTYGDNKDGIFFFTTDGNYFEWPGLYLYTDVFFEIGDVTLNVENN